MDDVYNKIIVISSLISAVLILIYYLNPKHSICFDCKGTISHRKENRFSISLNGEDHALCKKCFNKRQKQESLPAQNCSCCSKSFTTRMKIHEWEAQNNMYFLCSACNKKGENKLNSNFQLVDILTDEFIKVNTGVDSLQEYVDKSEVKIQHQDDLNSSEWNEFVIQSSSFPSWKSMESKALSELYSQQRFKIIESLRKST